MLRMKKETDRYLHKEICLMETSKEIAKQSERIDSILRKGAEDKLDSPSA